MKITLHEIKIRELAEGYQDLSAAEEGIVGYGGRLNIRPKYQREFVYDDKKRNAVIDTVWNKFPLNVMYWVKTDGADGIGWNHFLKIVGRAARDHQQHHEHCQALKPSHVHYYSLLLLNKR
jgi:hypothetical protein